MKKIAVAALLSIFAAAPALAGPMYVGVKVGQSDVGGTSTGWGVYGGYNIDRGATSNWFGGSPFIKKVTFSGEVEYTNLGSNSSLFGFWGAEYSAYTFSGALTGSYPINEKFSVIAKAGVGRTTYEQTFPYDPWLNMTTNTIGVRLGAAGEFHVTEKIGLRAGYDVFPDFSQLSAGAVFKF